MVGKKKVKQFKRMQKTHEIADITNKPTEVVSHVDDIQQEKEICQIEYKSLENLDDKEKPPETAEECDESEPKQPVKKPTKTSSQRELKSLLMLSSHGNKSQKSKLKDCLKLFEVLQESPSGLSINDRLEIPVEQINLFIFGNRASVLQMLELEQAELRRLGSDKWWILEVWTGNLAKVFHELHKQHNLTDVLFNLYQISYSSNPNVMPFLDEYIEQLARSGPATSNEKVHKAALYSLAAYNVYKAIEVYTSNHLFQYALCIAHMRLAHDDPVILQTYSKYGMYATVTGDYETAVQCHMRAGDFENAYKVLMRRNAKSDNESEILIKNLLISLSKKMNIIE